MFDKKYPISCYNKAGGLLNPGEGYWLLKVGEKLKDGDEYEDTCDVWKNVINFRDPVEKNDPPIRRKVEVNEPAFTKEVGVFVWYVDPISKQPICQVTEDYSEQAEDNTLEKAIKERNSLLAAHIYAPEELEIYETTITRRKLDV